MAQFLNVKLPMYGTMTWVPAGSLETHAVQNTWYGVTDFTEDVAVGVTTDTSDGTADHFTIPTGGAGDYWVSYSESGGPQQTGEIIEWSVFKNGSEVAECTSAKESGHTNYLNAGCYTILTLADADELSIRHRNISGTGGENVWTVQFSTERISLT